MPTHPSSNPNQPKLRWTIFVAASLALFALVPIAGQIQRPLRGALGDETLRGAMIALVLGAALFGSGRAWRKRWLDARGVAVTLVLGAGLAFVMLRLHAAAEALHVVQYFTVGILAFRALSCHLRDASVYLGAFALTALVGVADEFIQWLTPDRYWDLRDIALNAASGLAAQLWIALALRPPRASARPSRAAFFMALRLAVFTAAVLGLLLLFLPPRLEPAIYWSSFAVIVVGLQIVERRSVSGAT